MAGNDLRLELATAHLPRFSIDAQGLVTTDDGSPPPWVLRFLKPKIRFVHPFGVLSKAPYGDPGKTTWPALGLMAGAVLVALVALVVYGLVRVIRG